MEAEEIAPGRSSEGHFKFRALSGCYEAFFTDEWCAIDREDVRHHFNVKLVRIFDSLLQI